MENGCPAEHNSQPCHELPTSAPITRCLPSLPAHCFVPTLVLPSAESLLESDERQPGSLSSATRERLQKCFNNFPDICCNIQQLGVRARALTSLPYPRGGNVCMCWQPCGRFSVGHYFGFMDLRLVFGLDVLVFFFLWKKIQFIFLLKYWSWYWLKHERHINVHWKDRGFVLYVILFKYLSKSKDIDPIGKINTWNKWHYYKNYISSIKLQDRCNVNSIFFPPGKHVIS